MDAGMERNWAVAKIVGCSSRVKNTASEIREDGTDRMDQINTMIG